MIERSRTFLGLREYEEALNAAEKIFSYDPLNSEASALIDEIRQSALKDGKAEVLVRNKMAKDEGDERIGIYLVQARTALAKNRMGEARLTVDKILLLEPENKEALEMRRQIENKLKAA